MPDLVELRGPCNHLTAMLDTERRIIQRKCPQCSRDAGAPVYHCFDAVTGEPVDAPADACVDQATSMGIQTRTRG